MGLRPEFREVADATLKLYHFPTYCAVWLVRHTGDVNLGSAGHAGEGDSYTLPGFTGPLEDCLKRMVRAHRIAAPVEVING